MLVLENVEIDLFVFILGSSDFSVQLTCLECMK